MTITWHVDYLKVYQSDKDVVDAFIELTKETYEDVTKIKPSRGKVNDYLANNLDYTTPVEVKLYMKEYIDKIFE